MNYSREKSQPIFDRALDVLVKGVSSNFRFLGEKKTPVISKGKGAHIWDADGNKLELWEPVDEVFTEAMDGKTSK